MLGNRDYLLLGDRDYLQKWEVVMIPDWEIVIIHYWEVVIIQYWEIAIMQYWDLVIIRNWGYRDNPKFPERPKLSNIHKYRSKAQNLQQSTINQNTKCPGGQRGREPHWNMSYEYKHACPLLKLGGPAARRSKITCWYRIYKIWLTGQCQSGITSGALVMRIV